MLLKSGNTSVVGQVWQVPLVLASSLPVKCRLLQILPLGSTGDPWFWEEGPIPALTFELGEKGRELEQDLCSCLTLCICACTFPHMFLHICAVVWAYVYFVSMCVCELVCACGHIFVSACIYYTCVCMQLLSLCKYVHLCECVYMWIQMSICVFVHMCILICICIYVCLCVNVLMMENFRNILICYFALMFRESLWKCPLLCPYCFFDDLVKHTWLWCSLG